MLPLSRLFSPSWKLDGGAVLSLCQKSDGRAWGPERITYAPRPIRSLAPSVVSTETRPEKLSTQPHERLNRLRTSPKSKLESGLNRTPKPAQNKATLTPLGDATF